MIIKWLMFIFLVMLTQDKANVVIPLVVKPLINSHGEVIMNWNVFLSIVLSVLSKISRRREQP